jgi:hypothetical protein
MQQRGQLDHHHSLEFVTGGNAKFTIVSTATQNRFTYRVRKPRQDTPENAKTLFVSVLTGNDNEHDYTYIGFLRQFNGVWRFSYGNKSKISIDAPSVAGFGVIFNNFISLEKPSGLFEIWHEGQCCRCGRTLTVPESIASGIGPECGRIRERSTR